MIRNKKNIMAFITFLSTLLLLLVPTLSFACSCMPPGSPEEELQRNAAVFLGRVTKIEPIQLKGNGHPPVGLFHVSLSVDKIWKGQLEKTIVVTTPGDSAMCGYAFKKGEAYLIYGYAPPSVTTTIKKLQVTLCSRTKTLENAQDDIAKLTLLAKNSKQKDAKNEDEGKSRSMKGKPSKSESSA